MSDKKHIDRLFQEGFKDFEATPNDAVWQNIEAELNEKKKKRRVVPIWWRYAGVAALLLLLLTVGGLFINNTTDNAPNPVVDIENKPSEDLNINEDHLPNEIVTSTPMVSNESSQDDLNNDANKASESTLKTIEPSKTTTSITKNSSQENRSKSKLVSNTPLNAYEEPNVSIANVDSSEKETKSENAQNALNNSNPIANTPKTVVGNIEKGKNSENDTFLENKEAVKALINKSSEEKIVATNSDIKDAHTNIEDTETSEEDKRSIEDALNDTKEIIKDSDKLNNRWSISPNAAPVYFNTLGEGSPIDPQFSNNSKSGDINMSYGISASYAINKKLSVRSGLNRVNLGYNTNNVVVFQSVGFSSRRSALQNVDSGNMNSADLSLLSSETLRSNSPEILASSNASINQNLGYIEIPLEIQYTLSDKKFGVNVIGGFSSFFLNSNEVFSEQDNGTRNFLGEANNINKTSYSANLGLGLNYKISKRFDLNLEPIFKYQFNTFNNTSGNFSPFIIGVYTGFGIKF